MIRMMMWISNPNESSPHFHIRALHPHSLDVMRYFCGDVAKVQAFFKKGNGRQIWSNLQVNLLFENGVVGKRVVFNFVERRDRRPPTEEHPTVPTAFRESPPGHTRLYPPR